MNPTDEPKPVTKPVVPDSAKPATPVMDVMPPRPDKPVENVSAPAAATEAEPAFIETPTEPELSAPKEPPAEVTEDPDKLIEAEAKPDKKQQQLQKLSEPKPVKTPKQASDGVGAAIAATVIIVLGLATLAVYADLQSK